jgi:hypothetical protein
MLRGVDLPLPEGIAAGLDDVSQRTGWNKPAAEDFALPTETWREHIARRRRVAEIRAAFREGKIAGINDFITYNLDIIAYTQDFLSDCPDPLTIRAFYSECLRSVTILDPTCGSGAFLFAALNILEPLYEICWIAWASSSLAATGIRNGRGSSRPNSSALPVTPPHGTSSTSPSPWATCSAWTSWTRPWRYAGCACSSSSWRR